MNQLKQLFQDNVEGIAKELGHKNVLAAPKITKVVINVGTGSISKNKEAMEKLGNDIGLIAGQKPKVQKARVSIAGFNLREGMNVGLVATLRGEKMYSFLQKLISAVLPRLRDFRGVPLRGFDSHGNYTLGLSEHTVFPEIDLAKADPHGLQVTIVTTAKSAEEGKLLLEKLGMPFEKLSER